MQKNRSYRKVRPTNPNKELLSSKSYAHMITLSPGKCPCVYVLTREIQDRYSRTGWLVNDSGDAANFCMNQKISG